jgi:Leucine-rich repeat (LRR) protein
VAEPILLRCKTTGGVVEKRFKHDAEFVDVSRRAARRSALTHRRQLSRMGLTELPSELFRMKNVKQLWLNNNNLCALPSGIARMAKLEELDVYNNELTSLPPELGLLTNLKMLNVRQIEALAVVV